MTIHKMSLKITFLESLLDFTWAMELTVLIEMIRGACGIQHMRRPGGRLNKKDGLTRYGNSHVKDKTS